MIDRYHDAKHKTPASFLNPSDIFSRPTGQTSEDVRAGTPTDHPPSAQRSPPVPPPRTLDGCSVEGWLWRMDFLLTQAALRDRIISVVSWHTIQQTGSPARTTFASPGESLVSCLDQAMVEGEEFEAHLGGRRQGQGRRAGSPTAKGNCPLR